MEVEWGKAAGVLGLILCVIEIWKPKLSVRIEETIKREIASYKDFQRHYINKFRQLARIANSTFKEVAKGPQFDQSIDESKAQMLTSVENTKENLKFYLATLINYLVMLPLKTVLVLLNKIGRGRAIGGVGLVLAVLGVVL